SPDEVHVRGDQIAFVYRDKLVLMQTQGSFFTKEVGSSTHVQQLRIGGRPAVWITGAPHFFGYIGGRDGRDVRPIHPALRGNTLLWQRGGLTLRVEGKLTLDQALRIARSLE